MRCWCQPSARTWSVCQEEADQSHQRPAGCHQVIVPPARSSQRWAPSPCDCHCRSFCRGSSCSDRDIEQSTKGERLASENKAYELDIRHHGMTALQKPAWREMLPSDKSGLGQQSQLCCIQKPCVCLSSPQDKHRYHFQIYI